MQRQWTNNPASPPRLSRPRSSFEFNLNLFNPDIDSAAAHTGQKYRKLFLFISISLLCGSCAVSIVRQFMMRSVSGGRCSGEYGEKKFDKTFDRKPNSMPCFGYIWWSIFVAVGFPFGSESVGRVSSKNGIVTVKQKRSIHIGNGLISWPFFVACPRNLNVLSTLCWRRREHCLWFSIQFLNWRTEDVVCECESWTHESSVGEGIIEYSIETRFTPNNHNCVCISGWVRLWVREMMMTKRILLIIACVSFSCVSNVPAALWRSTPSP